MTIGDGERTIARDFIHKTNAPPNISSVQPIFSSIRSPSASLSLSLSLCAGQDLFYFSYIVLAIWCVCILALNRFVCDILAGATN